MLIFCHRHLLCVILAAATLISACFTVPAFAQGELSLTVRRMFGLGLGSQVRSDLMLIASGPANLRSVAFLIDGQAMHEVTAAPYQYTFHTDLYSPGWHELSAEAETSEGGVLTSSVARYRFLSSSRGQCHPVPYRGGCHPPDPGDGCGTHWLHPRREAAGTPGDAAQLRCNRRDGLPAVRPAVPIPPPRDPFAGRQAGPMRALRAVGYLPPVLTGRAFLRRGKGSEIWHSRVNLPEGSIPPRNGAESFEAYP